MNLAATSRVLIWKMSKFPSRSRSHKRAYDRKWKSKIGVVKLCHKLDGIGVGRIRTFPFLPIPFTTPSLMIQWKLGCRSRKQKRKNQPIARPGIEHCNWFILPLLLATPTMQFSLDHKRRSHKQNQCSATVGLIFSRSNASDYDFNYDSVANENQPQLYNYHLVK